MQLSSISILVTAILFAKTEDASAQLSIVPKHPQGLEATDEQGAWGLEELTMSTPMSMSMIVSSTDNFLLGGIVPPLADILEIADAKSLAEIFKVYPELSGMFEENQELADKVNEYLANADAAVYADAGTGIMGSKGRKAAKPCITCRNGFTVPGCFHPVCAYFRFIFYFVGFGKPEVCRELKAVMEQYCCPHSSKSAKAKSAKAKRG